MVAQHLQGLDAVSGIENVVILFEQVAEDLAVHLDVVGDQNGLAHIDRGDGLRAQIALGLLKIRGEGFLHALLLLVHGLVGLFKNAGKRIVLVRVVFHHARRKGLADLDLRAVLRDGIDLFHQAAAVGVVLSGEERDELVSSDAENRAVAEDRADLGTGAPDAGVALLMAVKVVDRL